MRGKKSSTTLSATSQPRSLSRLDEDDHVHVHVHEDDDEDVHGDEDVRGARARGPPDTLGLGLGALLRYRAPCESA